MDFVSKEKANSAPEQDQVEEIIELGEDTLEFISGARLMVCDTEGAR